LLIKKNTANIIITTLAILLNGSGIPTSFNPQSNNQTTSPTITIENKRDKSADDVNIDLLVNNYLARTSTNLTISNFEKSAADNSISIDPAKSF
jgi:hypothetical protein